MTTKFEIVGFPEKIAVGERTLTVWEARGVGCLQEIQQQQGRNRKDWVQNQESVNTTC